MPNRLTKEYWNKVYTALRKRGFSKSSSAKIAGAEWKRLKPSTKLRYEKLRRERESHLKYRSYMCGECKMRHYRGRIFREHLRFKIGY